MAVKKVAHFPSVRLALAGFGSLLLLSWVAFVPEASPLDLHPREKTYPLAILGTTLVALCILVLLGPVFHRGPRRDRWLAALVTVFPLLVFVAILRWFVERVL